MSAKKAAADDGESKGRKVEFTVAAIREEAAALMAMAAAMRKTAEMLTDQGVTSVKVDGSGMLERSKRHVRRFILNIQRELT